MWDTENNKAAIVNGGMGFRYPKKDESHGKWNTLNNDEKTGKQIDPALSLLDIMDEAVEVNFYELDAGEVYKRQVPVKYVESVNGRIPVTTLFDMQMSHWVLLVPGFQATSPQATTMIRALARHGRRSTPA